MEGHSPRLREAPITCHQSQSEVLAVRVSHGSNYPAFLFALVPSVTVNLVSFIEDTFGDLAAPQTPLGAVCWGVSSLSPLSKNHTLSEHCPPKPGQYEKQSDSTSISWQGGICIPNRRPP